MGIDLILCWFVADPVQPASFNLFIFHLYFVTFIFLFSTFIFVLSTFIFVFSNLIFAFSTFIFYFFNFYLYFLNFYLNFVNIDLYFLNFCLYVVNLYLGVYLVNFQLLTFIFILSTSILTGVYAAFGHWTLQGSRPQATRYRPKFFWLKSVTIS